MSKIMVLVRASSGPAAEAVRESVMARIEAQARTYALAHPEVTGLVLSHVVKPLAEDDPLVSLVAVWGEQVDRDDLLAHLVPSDLRAESALTATAARCSEIVFRRVRGFAGEGSPWTIKLAGTALRRDDFEPDAFFEYWTNVHAPIGGHLPGIGGYVVTRALDDGLGEESADAIIEQWYPDEQSFNDAQSTEMAQAAWNDVGNYAKTVGTAFWLMTESVVVEPPATGPGTLEV
ncbi:MAG: EthD family reductase [Frankiales bacterium]|nr:EthD family reductase [Frankiales bacterium]